MLFNSRRTFCASGIFLFCVGIRVVYLIPVYNVCIVMQDILYTNVDIVKNSYNCSFLGYMLCCCGYCDGCSV